MKRLLCVIALAGCAVTACMTELDYDQLLEDAHRDVAALEAEGKIEEASVIRDAITDSNAAVETAAAVADTTAAVTSPIIPGGFGIIAGIALSEGARAIARRRAADNITKARIAVIKGTQT